MKISNNSDSINVILSYNNKDLSLAAKQYQKLYYIKDKAYELFYPIKSDIKLKYNNKDLSKFLEQSIGLLFENKEKVKLQVEQIMGKKRQLNKKSNIKSHKNFFNKKTEKNINNSPQIKINERYQTIKTESLPKVNINSFSPTSSKSKKFLPPIKIKNKKPFDISSFKICRDCLTNETKYYCKKCNQFICSNCNNKKHKNHLKIEIDINNEEVNVGKYKEELINKLCLAVNNLNNLDNIQSNEINEDEWETKYKDAVNNLAQIVEEKKEEIKNNIKNNKNNKSDDNENKKEFLKRIKEEKNIINKIEITTKKDPFQLFNDLNKRERIINQTLKQGRNNINK